MTCFGKRIWKPMKFVLGGPSVNFGRSIAPTFAFTAHAMAHAVYAHYFEMPFVATYQN
jgi:quinol-cytochrome oxidoreductase complex cytochrome b subunit